MKGASVVLTEGVRVCTQNPTPEYICRQPQPDPSNRAQLQLASHVGNIQLTLSPPTEATSSSVQGGGLGAAHFHLMCVATTEELACLLHHFSHVWLGCLHLQAWARLEFMFGFG